MQFALAYNCYWIEPYLLNFFFFFFKQKTAYEIVSRDWSSDVCSSDLKQAVWYLNQPDRTSGSGFFTQIGVKLA